MGVAVARNSALLQPLSHLVSAFSISSFNPTVIGGKPSTPDVADCAVDFAESY